MAKLSLDYVLRMTVIMIVMGTLMVIGFVYISVADEVNVVVNGANQTLADVADPIVVTFFTIIMPLMINIGLIYRIVNEVRS